MSFARDFHICKCGHMRCEHSINYPRTRCLANAECGCVKFEKRLTKRAPDAAKATAQKGSISGKRPARTPRR